MATTGLPHPRGTARLAVLLSLAIGAALVSGFHLGITVKQCEQPRRVQTPEFRVALHKALIEAVNSNDPRTTEKLLELGAPNVLSADDRQMSELRLMFFDDGEGATLPGKPWNPDQYVNEEVAVVAAATTGALECARVLLDHGAAVNQVNEGGDTPLIAAAGGGCVGTARLLLDHGANPRIRDKAGESALDRAILEEKPRMVSLLLARGVSPDDQFRSREWGRGDTPLMEACRFTDLRCAKVLLEHGASPAGSNSRGENALAEAAAYGNVGALELLVQHGADVNARRSDGGTALTAAVEKDQPQAARWLLNQGAEVEVRSRPPEMWDQNVTPLLIAARNGYTDCARPLLEHQAKLEVRSERGDTPLRMAAAGESPGMVRLLLEQGANPNASWGSCPGALAEAASFGHIEAARMLIAAGAELNAARGWPPLTAAAVNGRCDVVRLLLASGARVNQTDDHGETPLRAVLRYGGHRSEQQQILRLLRRAGGHA